MGAIVLSLIGFYAVSITVAAYVSRRRDRRELERKDRYEREG